MLVRMPFSDFFVRRYLLGNNASPERIMSFRNAVSCVKPNVLAHRVKSVAGIDATRLLADIRIPSYYLQATGDRLIPEKCVEPFVRHIESLKVIKVEGPHMLLQANETECAEILKRLITEFGVSKDFLT
jgi:pimeloyl-ACP methyl ester carboxylesterase